MVHGLGFYLIWRMRRKLELGEYEGETGGLRLQISCTRDKERFRPAKDVEFLSTVSSNQLV